MADVKVEIKVTHIKNKWHIRLFKDDILHSEDVAESRLEIGPKCRELIRWIHKMGWPSQYAERSRHRWSNKKFGPNARKEQQ